MEGRFERYWPDTQALHHEFRTQPCFVCRLVRGDPDVPPHIVHEDEDAIAFLDGYPRAYGYTLVAPKEYREQVTADFSIEEYLDLQRLVYRVSEAVREEVGAERMYLYTFGPTRGTPTSTGTSSRCRPAYSTRTSRATGRPGAGVCSKFRRGRCRPWQLASGTGYAARSGVRPWFRR